MRGGVWTRSHCVYYMFEKYRRFPRGEPAYICFTFDNAPRLRVSLSQKLFALSARNYYRWRLNRVALPPAAHPRRIIKVSNITCVISLIVGATSAPRLRVGKQN